MAMDERHKRNSFVVLPGSAVKKAYIGRKYGMRSLSKNSEFAILRLDRGIQRILKRLDSRLRGNDDFLLNRSFLDRLCVSVY
jgi:hypothetical protein